MPKPAPVTENLRLRVFAGPNGSGKSTVINYVRNQKVNGKLIDFGVYINADDIAQKLRESSFSFKYYGIGTTNNEFIRIVLSSGLINKEFNEETFKRSYSFRSNVFRLKDKSSDERLAQILADFLRKKLLGQKKKFSFETVFSHPSKLDVMRQAVAEGYKVYLYFVSTKSPEINKYRVLARAAKGGHNVPPDKIQSRYYRSLELLHEASEIAYQSFFFDNSEDGADFKMFGHFKKTGSKKKWDKMYKRDIPYWFRKYYLSKDK